MRIDRFEVSEQLARDESSVIYRARDPNLRREVTIRVLDAARDERTLDQFRKSAQALAKLRHVGIVGVHDLGVVQGCPYLVMDHVPGQSLAERIKRRGPLPPRDAAESLRGVAEALEYAHRQGVLHRDVRPERVLLTPSGETLIGDFSVALGVDEAASGLTTSSTVRGQRGFLAPEQVEGQLDQIGAVTDVYGVGATLYFALTGQPPYDQDLPGDRRPRLRPASGIAPSVPAALDQVCATALSADPEQRYPSAALLAEDLSRFLAGRGVSRSRSWSRALPSAEGGVAKPALFLLLVVGVGTAVGVGAASLGNPPAAVTPPSSVVAVSPTPAPSSPAAAVDAPGSMDSQAVADLLEDVAAAVEADRFERAHELLAPLLARQPEHVEGLAWRAYVLALEGRWEEALTDAGRVLRLDPSCVKALETRVIVLTSTGRYHDALADASRWAEAEPENPDTHAAKCAVLGQLGRYRESLEAIEQALRMNPRKSRYYSNRALCRFKLGDPEGALRDFDQAAELFDRPRDQPFSNRGMIHREMGNHEAALADFRRGCELEPEQAQNWNCLAAGLLEAELPGALEALNKAIELEPTFFDALMNRGQVLRDRGDTQAARRDLLAARECAPPGERARVERLLRALQ